MREPMPKSRWAVFFAPLDEHDPGPTPKIWVAWAWLLVMPPGVAAVWFFWLRVR